MNKSRLFGGRELWKKIIFTIFVLAVSQLLARIPAYGINTSSLSSLFEGAGILDFASTLTGGSLESLSLGTFGVTSYITASIILQLFCIIIPKLESIRRDGEYGRRWYQKLEYILSVIIVAVGSIALALSAGSVGLFTENNVRSYLFSAGGWIIGGLVIITLGKLVEEYGIGNGISLILTFNILSSVPQDIYIYYIETIQGNGAAHSVRNGLIFLAGVFVLVLVAVYLQNGRIRVPVRPSRKHMDSISYQPCIPVPANISNVYPVIYAATLISIPGIVLSFLSYTGRSTGDTAEKVISLFVSSNWYLPEEPWQVLGVVIYIVLLVAMGLFASMMVFTPAEIADSMKKNGDTIEGVSPGKDTEKYFDKRRKVMSVLNVTVLSVLVILPDFLCAKAGLVQFSFIGTSLVIVISTLNDMSIRLRGAALTEGRKFELFEGGQKHGIHQKK